MSDYTDKAWEDIRSYEKKVVQPIFPNAHLKQSEIFCNPDRPVRGFSGFLSTRNLFKDTIYEYDGNGLFLHFTSLPILSTILKSGFIRMSDFNCLSDKSEINFASKNIKISSNEDSRFEKDKMFCLSACESKLDVIKNPYMWKQYACDGTGCSIEYKFTSSEIFNMTFGKIQYGKWKLKPLRDIKLLIEDFAIENNGFKINYFENFLTTIFAFHKDIKYKNENEIRLFYFQDGSLGNDKPHLNQFTDFYKRDEVREFIRIYLKGKNKFVPFKGIDDENSLSISPQIEIKRIILGPNVRNLVDVMKLIVSLRKEHHQDFEIWKINDRLDFYKINH